MRSTSLFDNEDPYSQIKSVNSTPITETGTVQLFILRALSNAFWLFSITPERSSRLFFNDDVSPLPNEFSMANNIRRSLSFTLEYGFSAFSFSRIGLIIAEIFVVSFPSSSFSRT